MQIILRTLGIGKRLVLLNKQGLKNALKAMGMSSLSSLKFDNKALIALPVDESRAGNSRERVHGACFSIVDPTPVENPQLVAHSAEALSLLGIKEEDFEDGNLVPYFSGNKIFAGSRPAAHCYCGHQFGYFSGQLGDGAAMYLGEVVNPQGERWELQLKGAGPTPFSRRSDGRKVLRSSIREFLCSEAMFHLGVPTTRAGTCVTSDSRVVRDIFYDGNPIMERCTIVSRIAPTFLRFGSFEIFKPEDSQTGRSGPSVGRKDILDKMLEYAVSTFYPEIYNRFPEADKQQCYLEFYTEVVKRTARLAALWQCVGFCHGVLNTDNMSIMGVTIDYGPFGFMDYFDADYICNASDNKGRYTYKKQPEICKWNLMKFAEALRDALPLDEMKRLLNETYDVEFAKEYYGLMRKKIGITEREGYNDEDLIQKLLWTMQKTACDFTNTFLLLQELRLSEDDTNVGDVVNSLLEQCQSIEAIQKRARGSENSQLQMLLRLAQFQPALLEQLGINIEELEQMKAQEEEAKKVFKLTPEEKRKENETLWYDWINQYQERLSLELNDPQNMEDIKAFQETRLLSMNKVNPKLILRNHIAQEAIDLAEKGDFSGVQNLLCRLKQPYDGQIEDNVEGSACSSSDKRVSCISAPGWAADLKVT